MKTKGQKTLKRFINAKKQDKPNLDAFNSWMIDKVKSIHYADNEQMCNAYKRVL